MESLLEVLGFTSSASPSEFFVGEGGKIAGELSVCEREGRSVPFAEGKGEFGPLKGVEESGMSWE